MIAAADRNTVITKRAINIKNTAIKKTIRMVKAMKTKNLTITSINAIKF